MSLLCHWTTATDADLSLPGDESSAKMERWKRRLLQRQIKGFFYILNTRRWSDVSHLIKCE